MLLLGDDCVDDGVDVTGTLFLMDVITVF